MKPILLIILLMMSVNLYAVNESSLRIKTLCEDGYKFVIVWTTKNNSSPTVIQMYEKIHDKLPPQPIECKGRSL